MKKIEERKFIALFYGFIFTFFASTSVVLANYFLNYEFINESFLRGNGIPMPYSHIRYTLMLTFALFAAVYLWSTKIYLINAAEKWLQLFFIVFSFLSLHVLAVRSALLALYISLLLVVIQYAVVRKKFLQSVGILAGLSIVLFIAIEYVPSLHNKLGFMNYDRIMYEKGQVKNLTDGIRIASIKGALEIAKENFWLGIGAGDLRNEMNNFYNQHYPEIPASDHKLPHNQFVWILATTGISGLLFFLFAFFFPFFYKGNYKHWLFVVFHLILFSSFITEATLEEQMGTAFYLIFLLLLMNHFKK
ncbi:MAG: O-antigen ligase family protein [Bacteroidota bacterium]